MSSFYKELPFFTEAELGCHHCGLVKMDLLFAAALVALRIGWNKPLYPNSVCRCPIHNQSEGGHKRSLHLTANPVHQTGGASAVDFPWQCASTRERIRFCRLAWSMGWSIGLSRHFVHLDARYFLHGSTLPQVVFYYKDWALEFTDSEIKLDN